MPAGLFPSKAIGPAETKTEGRAATVEADGDDSIDIDLAELAECLNDDDEDVSMVEEIEDSVSSEEVRRCAPDLLR